jgi:hypothetical protein
LSNFILKSFRTLPLLTIGKKLFRIIWISALSLILLLVAFHFWVVYHAEDIIQELVESKSNGKLKLEVKNFKFNWFSRKMELQDAVFYSTDTINTSTSYRFAVRKINLKVKAVWPVIFDKEVLITNLELKDPLITVTQLRPPRDKPKETRVSVPQEMGKIYRSIQDALEVLQVKKFELDNATFSLINKIQPEQQPVTISHIDLTIHDLKVDSTKLTGRERIFFSENIVLKSRDQDILFPDGRHRLTFQKFRINIEKKIVEFDSCTIAAVKTERSPTGFSIFFDKLVMTNINFDTLYRSEVIKADSVYCINPIFNLTADLDKRKQTRKAPKLDEIIRKLTGDLVLNYVIVNNASFDINTIRNGNPSSFRSQKNNFEMQGLRIDNDAARPLQVEKFAMAIRNYENFLRDSLYALQFDSIQVNNDRIYLNNFSFQKLNKGKPISNFSVPRFQLSGLSWDDLLFDRKLTAHQATLYDPMIDYKEMPNKGQQRKRRTIFDILGNLNDVLMLEDMRIVNGDINVRLEGGTALHLNNATMSVQSRALLQSNRLSGIRRSVNYLDFSKGILKINDLFVQLDSITYTGEKSKLKAKGATVTDTSGRIKAYARDVILNEIFINEFTGDVSIGGLEWQQANINIQKSFSPDTLRKGGAAFVSLTDINGKNTQINTTTSDKKITGFIHRISAHAFLLKPGEKPVLAGLEMSGKDLSVNEVHNNISASDFLISDGEKAVISNFQYKKRSGVDSIEFNAEQITFVPNVQMAIDKELKALSMVISKPTIAIYSGLKETRVDTILRYLPKGSIDKLTIRQPKVNISSVSPNGHLTFNWDGTQMTEPLIFLDVVSDSLAATAGAMQVLLKNYDITTRNGKVWHSGNSTISVNARDLSFQQLPQKKWNITFPGINGKDFVFDSMGKKQGTLDLKRIDIKNLRLSDSVVKGLQQVFANNNDLIVENILAKYSNSDDRFDWHNARFSKASGVFSIDSFRYTPLLDKDSFSRKRKFQADYIHLNTGKAIIAGFDPESYFKDSIVRIDKIQVNDVVFNDFRDKRPPFKAGIIKPLTGNRVKSIPFKLWIDSVQIENGHVTYSELNPQTGLTGTIPISRMKVLFTSVKSFGYSSTDSLRLKAEGYLLDTAFVSLQMNESYADSLSGFLLTARIDGADLKVLNPVLIPLSSLKVRSGKLDSLIMRVNGDEYYAYGEMQMAYDNLKIQILQQANQKGKKFKTALINFLANSLVIHNRNDKRLGLVFFVRNRDRSSFNYLVKMLMSGVSSSVGVKTTYKNLRPYKKAMKQRNLPSSNYD